MNWYAHVVHTSSSFRPHTHTHTRTLSLSLSLSLSHTHPHTHTHTLIPFEDREPTGAKSGHCPISFSFLLLTKNKRGQICCESNWLCFPFLSRRQQQEHHTDHKASSEWRCIRIMPYIIPFPPWFFFFPTQTKQGHYNNKCSSHNQTQVSND